MRRFPPLKDVKTTNVFPTEPAPIGLNYYVSIPELRGFDWCRPEWNYFLQQAYEATDSFMMGPRSANAFTGKEWHNLRALTCVEKDHLFTLGYNPIGYYPGIGPLISGDQVVGSNFNLSALMTSVCAMYDVSSLIFDRIETKQLELFTDKDHNIPLWKLWAEVNYVLGMYVAEGDFHSRSTSIRCEGDFGFVDCVWRPATWSLPDFQFQVKLSHKNESIEFRVPKHMKSEFEVIDRLWGTEWLDLKLEEDDAGTDEQPATET